MAIQLCATSTIIYICYWRVSNHSWYLHSKMVIWPSIIVSDSSLLPFLVETTGWNQSCMVTFFLFKLILPMMYNSLAVFWLYTVSCLVFFLNYYSSRYFGSSTDFLNRGIDPWCERIIVSFFYFHYTWYNIFWFLFYSLVKLLLPFSGIVIAIITIITCNTGS